MSGAVDPSDLAKARSEYAVIMAQIGVQQLRIERGELIKKADLERKIAAFYFRIRDTVLTLPDRNAAIIAADYGLDAHKLNLALVAILRKFLEDFADGDD
jgi:hypothetical protein